MIRRVAGHRGNGADPVEPTPHLATLLRAQKRMELHGIVQEGYQPCVRVLKAAEEKSLRRIG